VAVIQRFGGSLNLNLHVHALVLDGVFARNPAGALHFHATRRLTSLDVDEVLATVEPRIKRLWADEAPVLAGLAEQVLDADPAETARRKARRQCWASLMARTFGFDVLACPRCGGRLRLIALIEEAAVIERILRHLGVPTEIPAPRPARAPPLRLGTPDHVGRDDDAPMFVPRS
jgi:hypothetical protein